MKINGKCSLIVRGNKINKELLESELNMKCSCFIKKGSSLSKVSNKSAIDIWCYDIKIEDNVENGFKEILKKVEKKCSYIKELSEKYEVYLNCYLNSDFAQVGFDLSSVTIERISKLSIKVNFSILSWGMLENKITNDIIDSSNEVLINEEEAYKTLIT